MQAGLERYKAFLERKGKLGSEFVLQAATFFGPDKHFLERWESSTPPPPPIPTLTEVGRHNHAAAEAWLRRHRCQEAH